MTGVGSAGGDLAFALMDFFVLFRTANSGLESVISGFSLSESPAGGFFPINHNHKIELRNT